MRFIQRHKAFGLTCLLSLCCLVLHLVVHDGVYAQSFDRLSVEDGLSQNTANSVSQGVEGLLYIGTQEGLNVYDGYEFTLYRHNPEDPYSLADNDIYTTYVDKSGTLWVGTRTALHRFDSRLRYFERFPLEPPKQVSDSHISDITEDAQGKLWIAISGYAGLGVFDPQQDEALRYLEDTAFLPKQQLSFYRNSNAVSVDYSGKVWLGTGQGLLIADPDSKQFQKIVFDQTIPLDAEGVNDILHRPGETVWLGTNYGLYLLDSDYQVIEHFLPDDSDPHALSNQVVTDVFKTQAGQLWVATQNGLNKYEREIQGFQKIYHEPTVSFSLASNDTFNLFEDRTNTLWISTGRGLSKLPLGNQIDYLSTTGEYNQIEGDAIWSIHASRDDPAIFWIASPEGLYKYNIDTNTILQHYKNIPGDPDSLPINWLIKIFEDPEGKLWLGTRFSGVIRFDPETEEFEHFPAIPEQANTVYSYRVYSIVADSLGDLWFAGFDGLSRYDPVSNQFVRYGSELGLPELEGLKIHSMVASDAGYLWLGSKSGLFRFNSQSKSLKRYAHFPNQPNSLSSSNVLTLRQDRLGQLWIGTDQGLNRWLADSDRFERIAPETAIGRGQILSIEEDQAGNLWVGKNDGLVRYSPTTNAVTEVGKAYGLPVLEFVINSSLFQRDQLYFGAAGGLIYFNPETFSEDPYAPTTLLTELLINNQVVAIDAESQAPTLPAHISQLETVTLTHRDKIISFEFVAIHFASPKENQFAYRLLGFDNEEWSTARPGQHQVTYTNLPPGRYELQIKAANPSGVWGLPTSLGIVVRPAPWNTVWAWLGYAIAASSLIGFVGWQRYQRYRAEQWAQYQADHDTLTGLKNRPGFYRQLQQMLQQADVQNTAVAVLLMDLNTFKSINDTFGQSYGDKLLAAIAQRLAHTLTPYDCLIARVGGDEFTFAIPYNAASTESVQAFVQAICDAVQTPFTIVEVRVQLSISLGVVLSHWHGKDLNSLLGYADSAMYTAKRKKLPFCFYETPQASPNQENLLLLGEFREGLLKGQFELYYQPKLNLKTGTIRECEALIRWRHPRLGFISPGTFLPIAERTTNIHALTDWVIRTALSFLRSCQEQGFLVGVAINLSVYNLYDPALVSKLESYLNQYHINPGEIELEITETVVIEEISQVADILREVRSTGIKLALDDFGTGYSNLSYLKHLPINTLKIDKHFIDSIVKDERDRSLVDWIIKVSHLYGLNVVAEGVEDVKTFNLLTYLGCDLAQGYYISRPLPEEDFKTFLQNSGSGLLFRPESTDD